MPRNHTPTDIVPMGDGMYVRILGCGSAKPTLSHAPSSQVVYLRGKLFLIDCGEGTQLQMLRYHVSPANLHRVFISHLHGDHCLGLPGLLSTMSLHGLDHPVHLYGPQGLAQYVEQIVQLFCSDAADRIEVHEVSPKGLEPIYSDKSVTVSAFPLVHRVPTIGFRFDETPLLPHLNREMADFYDVPVAYFERIKQGADYQQPDGTVIPHARLTIPARSPHSYAYCSDTLYSPEIVPYVQGVGLLYHEATFEAAYTRRAAETLHSTTHQAAQIAAQAGVGTLMIGHYSARYTHHGHLDLLRNECLEHFPSVLCAQEGLTVDCHSLPLSSPNKRQE